MKKDEGGKFQKVNKTSFSVINNNYSSMDKGRGEVNHLSTKNNNYPFFGCTLSAVSTGDLTIAVSTVSSQAVNNHIIMT